MNNTIPEPMSTAERNKAAAINGAILGIIYIVLKTVTYQMSGMLLFSSVLSAVNFIIFHVILWYMLTRIRKANGGYMELKEAFGAAIVSIFVAGLIYTIFNNLYLYVIDPGYTERVISKSMEMLEKSGLADDKMDDAIAKLKENAAPSFSIGNAIKGYFGGVILSSLFGLVCALIVKKSRPVFDQMA